MKRIKLKHLGARRKGKGLESRARLVHTHTHTHKITLFPTKKKKKKVGLKAQDFTRTHNCGKVTWRCQTTGNYQKNLSAQSAAIFIVLWQIYTQSGTPGLAPGPALTNCQGRGAESFVFSGVSYGSLLQTCGFTFPPLPAGNGRTVKRRINELDSKRLPPQRPLQK